MQQPNSEGESGFPWAFAFDPVANISALGDVQRRGLRAASEAVDKLLSSMEPLRGRPGRTVDGNDGSDSDIRGLAGLWAELVTRGLSEMVRLGRPDGLTGDGPHRPDSNHQVWVDLQSGQSGGLIELAAGTLGSTRKSGEVWLYNHTSEFLGPVQLHASELRSPEGVAIPSAAVQFDPAVVAELPSRSSRGVGVSLGGDSLPAPGVYRGIVQASGAPAVVVKIELMVEEV